MFIQDTLSAMNLQPKVIIDNGVQKYEAHIIGLKYILRNNLQQSIDIKVEVFNSEKGRHTVSQEHVFSNFS